MRLALDSELVKSNANRRTPGARARSESGSAKISTRVVAALVDTNILVYRFDPSDPIKQAAEALLRKGIADGSLRVAHQAIVEFVAAVSRSYHGMGPLLSPEDARREGEELLSQFSVLYPNEQIVRSAIRGAATYQLSWFDAHMWAYAEHYFLDTLFSEDFQHGRLYGTVRTINPFVAS
jgi:predicted nucleic acid-binding protein